jgi:hypothetical protein
MATPKKAAKKTAKKTSAKKGKKKPTIKDIRPTTPPRLP